jgi:hypothetical protein
LEEPAASIFWVSRVYHEEAGGTFKMLVPPTKLPSVNAEDHSVNVSLAIESLSMLLIGVL